MIGKRKILPFGEAGQSLLEFALVLLFVILPVMFGIIDGSILFYKWVVLNNGAREGARAGAIFHSVGSGGSLEAVDQARATVIRNAVDATIGPLVYIEWAQQPAGWVSYDPDPPCIDPQDPQCTLKDIYRTSDLVQVTLTHEHTPFVGLVIGVDKMDLTATATMRIEPGGPVPTPTPP